MSGIYDSSMGSFPRSNINIKRAAIKGENRGRRPRFSFQKEKKRNHLVLNLTHCP